MLSVKSKIENIIRILLIAAFLFNALAPTSAAAMSTTDVESSNLSSDVRGSKGSVFKAFTALSLRSTFQDTTLTPEASVTPTSEARVTATPSSRQTLTPTFGPTGTPTNGTIPTLTETPAPTVTAVTPDPGTDTPLLSLVANPDYLVVNSRLALNWSIEGVVIREHRALTLQITLPEELSLQEGYEGNFDEATRTLTISVTVLSGQINLLTAASVSDTKLQGTLLDGEDLLTESVIFLPVHEEYVVDERGGEITANDGNIRIEFPADTFSERTVIKVGPPSGDAAPEYSLLGQPFEITARNEETRTEVSRFSEELKISVSYAELGVPQELQGDLHLYWYNTETKEWEGLPSRADRKTKTLIAYTDHFTVFDMDVNNWQSSHLPTVDSFQVSNFTGAATYSYPIEVPPGPGGLQPNVSLNYNSQVVDQSTLQTQASWVGMGWSLETGSIELDTHGTNGTPNAYADDTHLLNVAGVSTRIVKDPSGVYHATDENFWKISYSAGAWIVKDKVGNTYTFGKAVNFPYQVDDCNTTWMTHRWMLTKVTNIFGQEIVYEYTDQQKQIQYWGSCGWSLQWATTATYPKYIKYSNGKYGIVFHRGNDPTRNRQDYPSAWDTDSLYHSYDKYRLENIYVVQDSNGNGIPETTDTTIRRYDFTYAADEASDIIFPGYEWTATGKTTTLKSVKQYGTDGTTSLPPTTFTYGDNLHLTRADNGYGGQVEFDYELWYYANDARASYSIENNFGAHGPMPCWGGVASPWGARTGAGAVGCWTDNTGEPLQLNIARSGSVTTAIATAGSINNHPNSMYRNHSKDLVRPGGIYKLTAHMSLYGTGINVRAGLFNGASDTWGTNTGTAYIVQLPVNASKAEPVIEVSGLAGTNHATMSLYKFQLLTSIYRVKEKRVKDGNGHTYPFTYSYLNSAGGDSAAVNDVAISPSTTCPPVPINPPSGTCYAYFERNSEFRGHGFVTETGPDGKKTITEFWQGDWRKGRPKWTETRNGSTLLSYVEYTQTYVELPVAAPGVAERFVPYIGVLRNFVYLSAVENRIYNNNGTYNATRTLYTVDDYDTQTVPIYGNVILEQEQSWNGSAWSTYRQKEHFFSPNNSASRYLVSLPYADRVLDPAGTILATTLYFYDDNTGVPSTMPENGKLTAIRTRIKQDGTQWSQVSYGYDNYGNRTSVTAYSGYSTNNYTSPTTGARTSYTCYGGGGTLGGTACANDGYYTYPLWTKDPLGQITTVSWGYGRSVPLSETDPNGNVTSAEYDVFARMTKLIRPGDSSTSPTVSVAYTDANPFWTEIRQRIDTDRYIAIRRTYDGIGRQTKIEKGSSLLNAGAYSFTLDNTVSFLYPSFNSLQQSMPFGTGETAAYTTAVSDVLGRPLTVTPPNGNVISYAYNGLGTTVTDTKDYDTTSTSDVWGRVISVVPPTGPSVTYTYDLLNNLKTAARGGVTTEIKYDAAGRKLGMDDPDMGMAGVIGDDNWGWDYEYDALGNLTKQTDARGCELTLGYDLLNRLTNKTSSGAGCDTQVNTSYTYDVGTNGKGRRTSMNDASGSTSWLYDVRGRVTKETKNITGASAFVTEWDYNSADLLDWMKYPDTEELTYVYNNLGLLDSMTNNTGQVYIADTQYDKASRITSMDYGASVIRKTFNYYAWTTADQGGLLNTAMTTKLSDQTTLQSFAYAYDENANVETILDTTNSNQKLCFSYDSLNRLVKATTYQDTPKGCTTQLGQGNYSETYGYSETTGNLASKAGVNYTYDANHAHAVASLSNGNDYEYDENGNMTDRNVDALTFDLAYDAENRLVSVTGNGTVPTSTPTTAPTNTPTLTATHTPTPGGPTATFTPTPTATNTPGGPTATYTPSPTAGSDLIFADGFESGNLSAWTSSTTDSGDLSVSTAAAMKGTYGMQALLDDTNGLYVTDDTPNAEPRYRARFYLDPNSLTMANNDAFFLFRGFLGTSTDVLRVELRYSSSAYQIRAALMDDASTWVNTNWFNVTDAAHFIEVDWKAATASAANNGYLTLWIDGAQQADLTSVDNDTWRIDRARLGALTGIDAGTSGTFYLDAFESRRSSYIGPMAMGPSNYFALSGGDALFASTQTKGGYSHLINYIMPKPLLQSGTLTFTPADDAYIESNAPTANNGTDAELHVDNSPAKHFLLKFDVTGINSQTVTNAKLCLYNIDGANAGGDVHNVNDDSWQEETVTWNNAPTADSGVLASFGSVSPNTWYEVGLTTHITSDGTYSLSISDSTGGADYSSKEGANDPKLLVAVGGATPQSCSGTATSTPTPGATNTPTPTNTPGPSPTPTNTSAPTATQPPQGAFNSATFMYDGDGKRVKSTFNSTTTTYFVGNHYEVTGSTITKYYYAGSQRIAMRTNGTLNYLLGDHLGSTSLITDSTGVKTNEQRYKAWGETRYTFGNEKTKYQYTGQFSYTSDFGLYFYNARWYDPALGRFAQADTIIPQSQGAQAWDRYAYTNNNPVRYNDPSGHCLREKDYAEGTLCYFENMSWKERQSWVSNFAQTNDLEDWFNDMIGAIDFMMSDQSLAAEGGTAEVMDAAVLQAINDGWLMFKGEKGYGGGGQGWANFFQDRADGITGDALIVSRLQAEQVGVNYAWELANTQSAYNNSSGLDQIYFAIFKGGADGYRSMASTFRSNPLAVNGAEHTLFLGPSLLIPASDPRTSGPYLNTAGRAGYPAAVAVWSVIGSFLPPLGTP